MARLTAFLLLLLSGGCAGKKDSTLKSGLIPAGQLQVYFEQQGKGEPILFLHAGLQNHHMWDEQVKELSKEFTVVTIDLPFHGKTIGTDTSVLAKDVVRIVLDSLHLPKVSVAGLSMGAAVAEDFVIGYPQRVAKVVLMAAGINGYEKKYPVDSLTLSWYPKFTAALEAKDTALAALQFAQTWGEGIDHGDSLTKPAAKYVYQTTLATLKQHQLKGWPNLQDEPTAFDEITTLRMPVLILHGDKDLPFISVTSEYLEKNIPGAKRVLLKGAAHMLNLEQSAEVNRLLSEFLRGK